MYLLLGCLGHQCTITRFNTLFDDLVVNQVQIDPDIRSAVYSTVSCHGDIKTFEKLRELYSTSDSADEISRLLNAMGKCKDSTVIEVVLNQAISVRNMKWIYFDNSVFIFLWCMFFFNFLGVRAESRYRSCNVWFVPKVGSLSYFITQRSFLTIFIIICIINSSSLNFISHKGREMAWKFIKNNWETFQSRCVGGHARSNLIKVN